MVNRFIQRSPPVVPDHHAEPGTGLGRCTEEKDEGPHPGAPRTLPPNRIASLGSLQNFGGFIGGAPAPVVTGFIARSLSFVPVLLTGAAIAFAGALSYLFLVTQPIPEHAETKTEASP